EPSIAETLNKIKQANIVLHGIGNALEMAKRRQTETETYTKLENSQAIAEAFGYYFDQSGEVVHKVKTVGLQLTDLNATDYVITVAGGKTKAQAIERFMKQDKSDVLIIDEAATIEILQNNKLYKKFKMSVKVCINGCGRIGWNIFRQALDNEEIEIVAINDLTDADMLAHLLKYDSVHGTLNAEVEVVNNNIIIDGKTIEVSRETNPENIPWKELGVEIVIESTGRFTKRADSQKHID